MRTKVTFSIVAMFAFFTSISFFPQTAFGDTYEIFQLTSDQGYSFAGIDDSGDVVIHSGANLPGCSPAGDCYFTFLNGVSTGLSGTNPIESPDNGMPCVPITPPGSRVEQAVCNNGREAWTGFLPMTTDRVPSVYAGPDESDLLANGGEGLIFMNSLGDIVWDDHFTDHFYEAADLTTTSPVPEPGSIFLLGSGIVAAGGMMRRRMLQHRLQG
jgi:hypothetical protein